MKDLNLIELTNLEKRYGKKEALTGINLTIGRGKIIGLLGPNGSGKSNISDSIRWVLGEQSIKSLRGEKLEDVIFAGADKQKPMNFCEVALTIDNSDNKLNVDYSEVTIKRRAYRTGSGGGVRRCPRRCSCYRSRGSRTGRGRNP